MKKVNREYIELTAVFKDKRRKKAVIGRLELKETRLINRFFCSIDHECLEVRVKNFIGPKKEFEKMLG